jgi:hypothetical protein
MNKAKSKTFIRKQIYCLYSIITVTLVTLFILKLRDKSLLLPEGLLF